MRIERVDGPAAAAGLRSLIPGGASVRPQVEEIVDAVRRVGDGGSALDPTVVSQLLSRRRTTDALERLTPRERLVLEAMAQGLSNPAIADRLGVSVRAVEKHVTNIFDKLDLTAGVDADRRVLAVLRFLHT